MPTAAHFIYIPAVLLLGVVIGWILGSRAAADAYASQMRRSTPNAQTRTPKSQPPTPK
jgi:Tfp pilus assembly protein PilF